MRYKVLFDNILVKVENPDENEDTIIVDTDYQNTLRGRVVEIGNGLPRENNSRTPMEVRPQMIVIFRRSAAKPVQLEGEEYFIISQSDILVVEG